MEAEEIDSVQSLAIKELSNRLVDKIDAVCIEGLKRKGFEFKNNLELESFIKTNCRCEHNIATSEKVYFVNDIPFLLHKLENKIDFTTDALYEKSIKLVATCGSYSYL